MALKIQDLPFSERFFEKKWGGVCSYGSYTPGLKTTKEHRNGSCYGSISVLNKDDEFLVSSLWAHNDFDKEERKKFFDTIFFDEASPWRNAAKGAEYVLGKEEDPESIIGIRLPIKGKYPQELVNMLIASRTILENPKFVKLYLKMLAGGFPIFEAFFIMQRFYLDKGTVYGGYQSHTSIHNEGVNLRWFRDGTPLNNKGTIQEIGWRYLPCNAIWTGHTFSPTIQTIATYTKKQKGNEHKSPFAKALVELGPLWYTKGESSLPLESFLLALDASRSSWSITQ